MRKVKVPLPKVRLPCPDEKSFRYASADAVDRADTSRDFWYNDNGKCDVGGEIRTRLAPSKSGELTCGYTLVQMNAA